MAETKMKTEYAQTKIDMLKADQCELKLKMKTQYTEAQIEVAQKIHTKMVDKIRIMETENKMSAEQQDKMQSLRSEVGTFVHSSCLMFPELRDFRKRAYVTCYDSYDLDNMINSIPDYISRLARLQRTILKMKDLCDKL